MRETEVIDKIFNRAVRARYIHEATLLVENSSGSFSHERSYGGAGTDTPMLLASITKLFTTASLLVLMEQGRLTLQDKISQYFPTPILRGLHVLKGRDYSFGLTVGHLLFQTSGLPDYFLSGSNCLRQRIIEEDFPFSFLEKVAATKMLTPRFTPATPGKAYYGDINFDLLNVIVEKASGLPLAEAYQRYIFAPLGLEHTYLAVTEQDPVRDFWFMDNSISRPNVIRSMSGSGGGVSTARELLIFLKAFFGYALFSRDSFALLRRYNRLRPMGPLCYGGGHMQIPLGTPLTMFLGSGELLGHTGATASFAFYYPRKDLYFVGDFAQLAKVDLPIRLVTELAIRVPR